MPLAEVYGLRTTPGLFADSAIAPGKARFGLDRFKARTHSRSGSLSADAQHDASGAAVFVTFYGLRSSRPVTTKTKVLARPRMNVSC